MIALVRKDDDTYGSKEFHKELTKVQENMLEQGEINKVNSFAL